jgi:hypothetical protein
MSAKSSLPLSRSDASPHPSTPRAASSGAFSSLSDLGMSSPMASGYRPRVASPRYPTDGDRQLFSTPRPTRKEAAVVLREGSPTMGQRILPSFGLCLVLALLFGILNHKPAIGVPLSVGLAGLGIALGLGRRRKTRGPIPRIDLPTPPNAAQQRVSSRPSAHRQ